MFSLCDLTVIVIFGWLLEIPGVGVRAARPKNGFVYVYLIVAGCHKLIGTRYTLTFFYFRQRPSALAKCVADVGHTPDMFPASALPYFVNDSFFFRALLCVEVSLCEICLSRISSISIYLRYGIWFLGAVPHTNNTNTYIAVTQDETRCSQLPLPPHCGLG